jgi:5'-deoxynucleotidase YfbR-like HD superfamily hydrolase
MIAKDDLEISPKKTFEVLLKKLEIDCSEGVCRAMSNIELHTLCSLCLHRHIIGRLAEHKRIKLLKLVKQFRRLPNPDAPGDFWSYLDMTESILSKTHASIGSVFAELHALKRQPRVGWNATRRIGDDEFDRECPKPESVADHVCGCLLIAETFLPETLPDPDYSKREILRMLLIHDLAETFTGDKASFLKTNEDEREEDRIMRQISALSSFPQFAGVSPWRESWYKLKHIDGLNARIACDIDIIENFFQLMQYRRDQTCSIPDAASWASDVLNDLDTEIGREIFHSLRHHRTDLLQWFENESLP